MAAGHRVCQNGALGRYRTPWVGVDGRLRAYDVERQVERSGREGDQGFVRKFGRVDSLGGREDRARGQLERVVVLCVPSIDNFLPQAVP